MDRGTLAALGVALANARIASNLRMSTARVLQSIEDALDVQHGAVAGDLLTYANTIAIALPHHRIGMGCSLILADPQSNNDCTMSYIVENLRAWLDQSSKEQSDRLRERSDATDLVRWLMLETLHRGRTAEPELKNLRAWSSYTWRPHSRSRLSMSRWLGGWRRYQDTA